MDTVVKVYKVAETNDGQQYVAICGVGPYERVCGAHFSSSSYFAREHDIVPSMRKKFGVDPIWVADVINFRILDMYSHLVRTHESMLKTGRTNTYSFLGWLENEWYLNNKNNTLGYETPQIMPKRR